MFVMFRRRHPRAVVATLSAFTLSMAGLVASSGVAGASVGSDQAQIAALKQKTSAQGERVKSLVSRYNEVEAQVTALDARIAQDQRLLDADQRAETVATLAAQRVAVRANTTNSGMDSPTLALLSPTVSIPTTVSQK